MCGELGTPSKLGGREGAPCRGGSVRQALRESSRALRRCVQPSSRPVSEGTHRRAVHSNLSPLIQTDGQAWARRRRPRG
ncbi:hypothetical protein MTO96_007072 [Rhipicephalus appendiculatus]